MYNVMYQDFSVITDSWDAILMWKPCCVMLQEDT